jgi:hypothetical protein
MSPLSPSHVYQKLMDAAAARLFPYDSDIFAGFRKCGNSSSSSDIMLIV